MSKVSGTWSRLTPTDVIRFDKSNLFTVGQEKACNAQSAGCGFSLFWGGAEPPGQLWMCHATRTAPVPSPSSPESSLGPPLLRLSEVLPQALHSIKTRIYRCSFCAFSGIHRHRATMEATVTEVQWNCCCGGNYCPTDLVPILWQIRQWCSSQVLWDRPAASSSGPYGLLTHTHTHPQTNSHKPPPFFHIQYMLTSGL